MVPQQGIPQQMAARPGIPIQGSPDNARVIREASRLQEQQRLLQSRQHQGQQVQQAGAQQLQTFQQFNQQQAVHSPSVPAVNGSSTNAAMLAAMQAASGIGSPSPYNNTQGVATASPRMGQPNHISGGVLPTITNIQNQLQKTHPNLPPEQIVKMATDRLHHYQQQQQRMAQAAMNVAVGNMANVGALPANFQVPPDPNFQGSPPQANGNVAMQNSPAQFSPMMRVAQPVQQGRVPVGSSPSMNGSVLPQQSRSATPQTQRSGSVQTGPVPGTNQSPRPPTAQMATNWGLLWHTGMVFRSHWFCYSSTRFSFLVRFLRHAWLATLYPRTLSTAFSAFLT
jgi:chromatin modification-related protein VID21